MVYGLLHNTDDRHDATERKYVRQDCSTAQSLLGLQKTVSTREINIFSARVLKYNWNLWAGTETNSILICI